MNNPVNLPEGFPTLQAVQAAQQRIRCHISFTPLIEAFSLSHTLQQSVYLKCENFQYTGSFKIRGAANSLLQLTQIEKERGVLTVSSGNHGRAVAYMARRLGIPATIVVSQGVPQHKRDAIAALGATLQVQGTDQEQAMAYAEELCHTQGLTMIHPFDDPRVIAGQGTIGLEILRQLPEINAVAIPLSGGGLLAGIALAIKSLRPQCRVIGVSTDHSAAMVESLKAGQAVHVTEQPSLADALIGDLNTPNRYTLRMVQTLMDEVVQVSEAEIAAAMRYAVETEHVLLEGGGAVPLAAALRHKLPASGPLVLLCSGSNVAAAVLRQVLQEYPE